MTRDDCAIMCVMRFIALLAWICEALSSAMSAIWSICWARACLDRSILAFWYAFAVSPFFSKSWICFLSSGSCLAAFWASRRACFAWNCHRRGRRGQQSWLFRGKLQGNYRCDCPRG